MWAFFNGLDAEGVNATLAEHSATRWEVFAFGADCDGFYILFRKEIG